MIDFASFIEPAWRDTLKFTTENGYLKNVLGKRVPEQAGQALRTVVSSLLDRNGLSVDAVAHWILHAGGEKIIAVAREALGVSDAQVASSRAVLEKIGNVSSPSVLFVLEEEMNRRPMRPGECGVIASFGAGFAAHAALVEF